MAKTTRELEFDYLAASSKIEELLQKKTGTYRLIPEIENLHGKLMSLGAEILKSDNPQALEAEYLATAAKLHAKLHEKTAAYALLHEVERLHVHLIELGRELGWQSMLASPMAGMSMSNMAKAVEPAAELVMESPDAVAV